MNLANLLTSSRLILSPVFLWLFMQCHSPLSGVLEGALGVKIALVSVAWTFELTDIFDGVVARRWNQSTNLGKLIDPLADSVSRFTVFLCFLWAGFASLWMVAVIFWRDSMVAYLRSAAAQQGVAMGARNSGKIKAIIQGVVIITILSMEVIAHFKPDLDVRANALRLMGIAALVTAWSALDYFVGSLGILKKIIGKPRP